MNEITPREDRSEAVQSAGVEERSRSNWFQQHPRVVYLVVVLAIFTHNLPIQIGSMPNYLWPGTGILCPPACARLISCLVLYSG